ncbi:hypothetical protein JOM56_000321 [Amanita muscaria]
MQRAEIRLSPSPALDVVPEPEVAELKAEPEDALKAELEDVELEDAVTPLRKDWPEPSDGQIHVKISSRTMESKSALCHAPGRIETAPQSMIEPGSDENETPIGPLVLEHSGHLERHRPLPTGACVIVKCNDQPHQPIYNRNRVLDLLCDSLGQFLPFVRPKLYFKHYNSVPDLLSVIPRFRACFYIQAVGKVSETVDELDELWGAPVFGKGCNTLLSLVRLRDGAQPFVNKARTDGPRRMKSGENSGSHSAKEDTLIQTVDYVFASEVKQATTMYKESWPEDIAPPRLKAQFPLTLHQRYHAMAGTGVGTFIQVLFRC